MKLEDLTQEKLDEILADQEAAKNSLAGLKADLAKFKAKAKGAEIDPESHAELQTQVETLKAELDKANKAAKKANDEFSLQMKAKDEALSENLISNQLTSGLASAGIDSVYFESLSAMHSRTASIALENGKYVAKIGDKPLVDAIKEWAASDAAKPYKPAPINSGAGAGGGNGGGKQTQAGNLGGTKQERIAALKSKFPDLES